MKANWMFTISLLLVPTLLTLNVDAKTKKQSSQKKQLSHKKQTSSSTKKKISHKKAAKGPRKITINFESDQPAKGRGPASVEATAVVAENSEKELSSEQETSNEAVKEVAKESAKEIAKETSKESSKESTKETNRESSLAISTHQGSCSANQDSSGWHLPVDETAYSCTLSGRNKPTDPSRGLGFFVDRKNFKIFSMTEGEVVAVVGELMGCKVVVKPARCPAGMSAKDCTVTYTIPNIEKTADNECKIPGIKMGTQLKACQKIAEVQPSKSFNLVRIETNGKAPLQDVISSYKKSSKERKQCSRDKALLATAMN